MATTKQRDATGRATGARLNNQIEGLGRRVLEYTAMFDTAPDNYCENIHFPPTSVSQSAMVCHDPSNGLNSWRVGVSPASPPWTACTTPPISYPSTPPPSSLLKTLPNPSPAGSVPS